MFTLFCNFSAWFVGPAHARRQTDYAKRTKSNKVAESIKRLPRGERLGLAIRALILAV